ncbi:hypothetical protein A2U01_0032217 [Trifolium medium]|uniref:Uncharacterized protein n=1 Tax=Trifolium medium TaxID=97028 RepID=A0A392PHJ4_9FABA|nr:hypothetical protein [Trifolium medium]
MKHLEESHATLRVDVDGIKDQMGKIFDMVQTMVNNPQPIVNPVNQPWPTYGLPHNYVPPEDDSNDPPRWNPLLYRL